MLVVRRWRLAGVLLAFAFHFALAMDPGDVVFNFSAILLAFFFLFLPDDFRRRQSLPRSAPVRRRVVGSAGRVSPMAVKSAAVRRGGPAARGAHLSRCDGNWPDI